MSALTPPIAVADWFEGKSFTSDWTSHNFPIWSEVLAPLRNCPVSILEVGSWEGRSALFFLNYLPDSRITCIDTFAGSKEQHDDPEWHLAIAGAEKRFDDNLVAFGNRVEKIKSLSVVALPQLGLRRNRFDLIYIDGSHRAADVYADATLAWGLLKPGGLLIFDDYLWDLMPDEAERPKLAIDAFMSAYAGEFEIVSHGYQMILRRKRSTAD